MDGNMGMPLDRLLAAWWLDASYLCLSGFEAADIVNDLMLSSSKSAWHD